MGSMPIDRAAAGWDRVRRSPGAGVGFAIVGVATAVGAIGPLVCGDPSATGGPSLGRPSPNHLLGTDRLGHDELTRMVFGLRLSLVVSVLATVGALAIGVALGAGAARWRGRFDRVLVRVVDVWSVVPYLLLALVVLAVFGTGAGPIVATLSLIGWPPMARAARVALLAGGPGSGHARRAGALARPLAVLGAMGVGFAIVAESALSFLQRGPHDPTPSLGRLAAESQYLFTRAPWLLLFPAAIVTVTAAGCFLAGHGLRAALGVTDADLGLRAGL